MDLRRKDLRTDNVIYIPLHYKKIFIPRFIQFLLTKVYTLKKVHILDPHDLWIKFLQERIEVATYCSQDQIEMYTDLLQRTFDLQVSCPGFLPRVDWFFSSQL